MHIYFFVKNKSICSSKKKKRRIKAFKKKIDIVFAYYNIHIICHIVNVKAYQHNLRVEKLFLFLKLIKYQVEIYPKILPTKKRRRYLPKNKPVI